MYKLFVKIREKKQLYNEAKKSGESFALLDKMNKEMRRLKHEYNVLYSDPLIDEEVVQKLMEQRKKMERERMTIKKRLKQKDWLEQTTADDDDDLLRNLWETSDAATIAPTGQHTRPALRVIDEITYPAGWTGKAPKDILAEYCRKKDKQCRVTFHPKSNVYAANYQFEVKISWSSIAMQTFSETSICFRRKTDAENYMAVCYINNTIITAILTYY